jgi:hypothetical protein
VTSTRATRRSVDGMASDETAAVLRAYAEAWQRSDPTLFDFYADDCTFHYFGTTDLAGTHVGKEACVTAMIAVSTRAPRTLLEIVDVLVGDSLGAIVVRERLERDGESHEVERVARYRVADGRIAECWILDEDQALIDHLWRP